MARFANKKVEKDKRIVDTEGRCDAENRGAMLLASCVENWKCANRLIVRLLLSLREESTNLRSCASATPFLVVATRETKRQGNQLIIRRCLYERCTCVYFR